MYVGMVNAGTNMEKDVCWYGECWRTMYVGMVNAGTNMEKDVCWYGECWVVHGERCMLVW